MLLEQLRKHVLDANLELVRRELVLHTFGNASAIARKEKLVVIKPSGVPYEKMRPEDLVVTDLEGKIIEGSLRPSSDLATHLVLYKAFAGIGGIAHTHSEYATAFAQARRPIPCFGTTHADYFHGPVLVTDPLTGEEIVSEYEKNTGEVIVRAFAGRDAMAVPAILVANHGPFAWGADAAEAAHHAEMLEAVARMAWLTTGIEKDAAAISSHLHNRHFHRKHGPSATYGQAKKDA